MHPQGAFLICENLETGCQQVFASESYCQTESFSGDESKPVFCSELLTTLTLSWDRRYLAVGSLTRWEMEDQADVFDGDRVSTYVHVVSLSELHCNFR